MRRPFVFFEMIKAWTLYGDSPIKEWDFIRLIQQKWLHITEEHSEMAGYFFDVLETIQEPEAIYEGKFDELLAVKEIEPGKYLIVAYKEMNKEDGFVITAFLTRRFRQIERRTKLWPQ